MHCEPPIATMKTIRVETLAELLVTINGLMLSPDGRDWVFRGQPDAEHPIRSTFSRRYPRAPLDFRALAIETLVTQFAQGLAGIGDPALLKEDRWLRLEIARHFGVPSPLIDFSFSPFVALWFAFDGEVDFSWRVGDGPYPRKDKALYAFNPFWAAVHFTRKLPGCSDGSYRIAGVHPIDFFRGSGHNVFEGGYPMGVLRYIPMASHTNTRMVRQRGCFMYDTMIYEEFGANSFDTFFGDDAVANMHGSEVPVLWKIVIPAACADQVFAYLDAIGIDGGFLMGDPTGVAADTKNMFNKRWRFRSTEK